MANTSLGKDILLFGVRTMSSAHLNPDIKLMFTAIGRRAHHRIFAFQDCILPQLHCHADHKDPDLFRFLNFAFFTSRCICLPTYLFTVPLLLFEVMTPASALV